MRIFFKCLFLFIFSAGFMLAGHRALAYYDLEVESISIDIKEPAVNQPVIITVKVKNRGSSAITDNTGLSDTRVNFTDFDYSRMIMTPSDMTKTIVDTGEYITYKVEGSFFSEGVKNVGFGLNESGILDEINDANNYVYFKVTVVPPYDFLVESITAKPAKPAVTQDCAISVKIKNNGFAQFRSSVGASAISYLFPGFTVDSRVDPVIDSDHPVKSGEYFYYTFYGQFTTEGEKDVSFDIDTTNQIEEKDEDNNIKTAVIDVGSPTSVDLAVDAIKSSIEEPIVGEETTLTVTVKNVGQVSLISDKGLLQARNTIVNPVIEADIRKEFDDFTVTEEDHGDYPSFDNPLDPYTSSNKDVFTYTYKGYFTGAGDKDLSFAINLHDRLREADQANDALSASVTAYADTAARDDFMISDVRVDFMDSASARISWKTSKKTKSRAMYKRDDYTGYIDTGEDEEEEHSQDIFDLVPSKKYNYKITASYGTVTKTAEGLNFFTPADDSIKITSGPAATVTDTTAVIDWSTDRILASSTLYYMMTDADDYTSVVSKASETTGHEVKLEKLKTGNYEYYLISRNRSSGQVQSALYYFSIGESTSAAEEEPKTGTSATSGSTAPAPAASSQTISNSALYSGLKGKIILKVEANGEAYYIHPSTQKMYYLGRPDDAFSVMREQGVGITDANLEKIPIGLSNLSGADGDGDGLSDIFEDAIGTDKTKIDSDGDGFTDSEELRNGYYPAGGGEYPINNIFAVNQKGKIFLQVEGAGEAWYVNPADGKRYFLGRPADAFNIMRTLGLGISNSNFDKL